MPKFRVTLGRLVRQNATIIVEAPGLEYLEDRLTTVYDKYDGDKWEDDNEWGCEESDTHIIDDPADESETADVSLAPEDE